jgi:hypothetical protein
VLRPSRPGSPWPLCVASLRHIGPCIHASVPSCRTGACTRQHAVRSCADEMAEAPSAASGTRLTPANRRSTPRLSLHAPSAGRRCHSVRAPLRSSSPRRRAFGHHTAVALLRCRAPIMACNALPAASFRRRSSAGMLCTLRPSSRGRAHLSRTLRGRSSGACSEGHDAIAAREHRPRRASRAAHAYIRAA